MKSINIAGRKVGGGNPCFIIAEAGINHNGELKIAKKMVDAAKECGADAIKFQTFKAEEFVSDKKQRYSYVSRGRRVTESMYSMFKRYELAPAEFQEIMAYCRKKGIIFFSTPQNISDLELLLEIGVPVIKVGSDDMNNLPLLKNFAQRRLPIIISTGMAHLQEVVESAKVIERYNKDLIVLLCVSSYPACMEEVNLSRINRLMNYIPDAVIGYSDHTDGILSAIGAVCLGAKVIEKHFTLDKKMPGPDQHFSADPAELKGLVEGCRMIEKALGNGRFTLSQNELRNRALCRRSLVAKADIKKGTVIREGLLTFKRPGWGVPPKKMGYILGKVAIKDIAKDKLIKLSDLK